MSGFLRLLLPYLKPVSLWVAKEVPKQAPALIHEFQQIHASSKASGQIVIQAEHLEHIDAQIAQLEKAVEVNHDQLCVLSTSMRVQARWIIGLALLELIVLGLAVALLCIEIA